MRVLNAHSYYLQPGGEDTEFEQETALLRSHGHEVYEYIERNERVHSLSPTALAVQTVWSRPSFNALSAEIRRFHPDLVHFHNIFPLISPSAYYASHALKVPVIQTLYNPRLICPAASFYRNGRLCTDCIGRFPWPGVLHACYHHSRSETLVVVAMLASHRWLGTWAEKVSKFLVATAFYRDLFVRGGLPARKIAVKPNFVLSDPGYERGAFDGEYALFVGRLDPEKGVRTLLRAWQKLTIPLVIRGEGQLEEETRQFIEENGLSHITIVSRLAHHDLAHLMRRARFLVWPSEGYYETFGLAAAESYAAGVPVIASGIGVMKEMVRDFETGLHFAPADANDLAVKAQWLWNHPDEGLRMGANARREYENSFTSERNYQLLIRIYTQVLGKELP